MVHAAFTIDIPDGVWVGALSRSHLATTFRILSAIPGTDGGYGLVETASSDAATVAEEMRAADAVRSVPTGQSSR